VPFDPSQDRFDQLVTAPLIEFLGVQPGRNADQVLAILTFRFLPASTFASQNVSLTQAQVVRLRDDLDSLLCNPNSWLFIAKE
jgi:hypothetical protein